MATHKKLQGEKQPLPYPAQETDGFSSGLRIPGPAASELVARPDLASEGRGTAQTDLGPTPPSPVTLEHGLRERMEKMLSSPQEAVFIGK